MSSEWRKLVEEAEALKFKISKKRRYRSANKALHNAVRALKYAENALAFVDNRKLCMIKNELTQDGIKSLQKGSKLASAVKLLYNKYGTKYVTKREMDHAVESLYGSWLNFEEPARKGFKTGIFEKLKAPGYELWRISPTVVKYLK